MNFTLLKIAACFITGILLGSFVKFSFSILIITGVLLLLLFCFSYLRARKTFFPDPLFGLSGALLFVLLGMLNVSLHSPKHEPADYSHFSSATLATALVRERLKPTETNDRFIISVQRMDERKAAGKILLNVKRDSSSLLQPGELIAVPVFLINSLKPPLNPYTFNYKNYLEKLGIYGQLTCTYDNLEVLETKNFSLQSIAGKIRNHLVLKLKELHFSQDEFAVIQALLLGQRQEISPSLYTNYKNAGVIHILAISGLHVGILLLLLSWLLQPLEKIKYGQTAKALLVLLILWAFAIISGLSPSVVRAVTMFSFIALGLQLNRKTKLLNVLFISLLALLLINPNYLFQVGFQLSYAAVVAIALFQPLFLKLYYPPQKVLQYFWKLISVTLAAQLGVLPLSLYYFHQFPGLFFVSNLLILPFLGVILGMGLLVILMAILNWLPPFLSQVYGFLIHLLNEIVEKVAAQESFIFHSIYMSLAICFGLYLLMFTIFGLLSRRNFKNIVLFLVAIIGFEGILILDKMKRNQSEIVIFQKTAASLIAVKRSENLTLLESPLQDTLPAFIADYTLNFKMDSLSIQPMTNVILFDEKNVLIVDNTGVYDLPKYRPDILILTGSPKLNLTRLISKTKPQQILADGSNYKSYVNLWRQTCIKEKVPFHNTAEKGAFILKPKSSDFLH